MAVCNFPQTSPPIGQASTSCLRKFTIHFRRPEKLKQKQNAPYKGEYGFDWLRDEYIYPMEKVIYNERDNEKFPTLLDKYIELCKDPINLRQEYLKDVVPLGKEFKLNGQDYYPAWLSIFACNLQGDNADAGSEIHKDGVYLDLQLDEIDEIIDDGTEIFFEPSDPCLKITPDKISISKFLKTTREKRILDSNTGKPEIHYYLLENAVKIICQGDTLKEHGKIKVFAKLGATEIEVGRLMVYKNNNIGKANFVVVNVITEDYNNNKVIPQSHPSLKYLYNNQSFNQAMIRAEVSTIEDFDLVALKNKDKDISSFLEDAKNTSYINGQVKDPEDSTILIDGASAILKRLSALYKKYGKHAPKGKIGLNEKKHHNTYLFFTAIDCKAVGLAHHEKKNNVIEFGNVYIIFKNGLTEDRTIVHEAAHSFSLTHTFSAGLSPHAFHKGYTDNFMDYTWYQYRDSFEYEFIMSNRLMISSSYKGYPYLRKHMLPSKDNKYKGKMYSFFKWQWDLMRNDPSIKK